MYMLYAEDGAGVRAGGEAPAAERAHHRLPNADRHLGHQVSARRFRTLLEPFNVPVEPF